MNFKDACLDGMKKMLIIVVEREVWERLGGGAWTYRDEGRTVARANKHLCKSPRRLCSPRKQMKNGRHGFRLGSEWALDAKATYDRCLHCGKKNACHSLYECEAHTTKKAPAAKRHE